LNYILIIQVYYSNGGVNVKKNLYSLRYLLLVFIFGGLIFATSKLEKVPSIQQFLRKISSILNSYITSLIVIIILAAITITGIVITKMQDKQK